jgi:GT2 family glycosyltransferase
MRPAALVDVVMPIYGEWALAEKALDALPAAMSGIAEGYRVIVVDNGTPAWKDQTGRTVAPGEQAAAVKERMRPQDGFFRLEENKGYPGGLNFAVSKGRSPLIFIVTADVLMQPGSALPLVRELDNSQVGIVGPKLLFPEGSPHGPADTIQHAGIGFDIGGRPFHCFIGWRSDNPKVNKREEVAAVTGACLMTRRTLWSQMGGLYEGYGAGTFEDIDFCFACRQAGAKVIYQPLSVGYHWVGGSIVQGAGSRGFNLAMNETIFKGRWAHMLAWDEWRRV